MKNVKTLDLKSKDAEALIHKSIADITDSDFHKTLNFSVISAKETTISLSKLCIEFESRNIKWVSKPNSKSKNLTSINKTDLSKKNSKPNLSDILWSTQLAPGSNLELNEHVTTTLCSSCQGNKVKTCPSCSGTPIEHCYMCEGQGRHLCYTCDGGRSGGTYCSLCNGSGKLKIGFGTPQQYTNCHRCFGTGFLRCSRCGDQRWVNCDRCNGRGQTTCSRCNGKSIVTCLICHGYGSLQEIPTLESTINSINISIGPIPKHGDKLLNKVIKEHEDFVKELKSSENYTLESLKQDLSLWSLIEEPIKTQLNNKNIRHTITIKHEEYKINSIDFKFSTFDKSHRGAETFITNTSGKLLRHSNVLEKQYSLISIMNLINAIDSEYKKRNNEPMLKSKITKEYISNVQKNIKEHSLNDVIKHTDPIWKRRKINYPELILFFIILTMYSFLLIGLNWFYFELELSPFAHIVGFSIAVFYLGKKIIPRLQNIVRYNDPEIDEVINYLLKTKEFKKLYSRVKN